MFDPRVLNVQKLHLPQKAIFWGLCLVLLAIPLKIHTYHFRPADDANRHIAKALSGKDWPDILVMDASFQQLDHNEGWHWILERLHAVGLSADQLLLLSSVGLAALFLLGGLFLFEKHPLAWGAALLVGMYLVGMWRIMSGRPLVLSASCLLVLLHIWREPSTTSRKKQMVMTVILIGIAGWVHGAWYLFALLPISLVLAGRTPDALGCGGAWLGGSVVAGLLNGSPVLYLWGQVRQTVASVDTASVARQLVSEFQPSVDFTAVVLLLLLLMFWKSTLRNEFPLFAQPAFWLALMGWILSTVNARFWADWGVPAFLLLIASILACWEPEETRKQVNLHTHALSALFLSAALFLTATSDMDDIWSNGDYIDPLSLENPEHREWLPEPGGILYNGSMFTYYYTFFENPHAEWRYMLGHEPALMPAEDLKIYRDLTFYTPRPDSAYQPWVDKMTPADRMVLIQDAPPRLPDLEWKKIASRTWSGRLPR